MNNRCDTIVLLTATITPPKNARNLMLVDSNQRLKQYEVALTFYLKLLSKGSISHIVFVDNSNSDCSRLIQLVSEHQLTERVEIISFDGLDYPPDYGRGYGEFKLVQHAMQHSTILTSAHNETQIWKVTGRYIVKNLEIIIQNQPESYDLYCNCRNYPTLWADLFILSWKKSVYDLLLGNVYIQLREDDGFVSSEKKFRRIVDENIHNTKIVKRFNTTPLLIGVRGYDNQPYEKSYKYQLRKIANKLLPFVWI